MAELAQGSGGRTRRLSLAVAIVALFVVGVANCFTVLLIGFGCNPQDAGPETINPTTPAAAVCRLMDPGWGRAHYYGSKSAWEKLFHGHPPEGAYFVPGGLEGALISVRALALLFSPIALTLIGVVLTKRRGDLAYFGFGTFTAAAILVSFWVIFTLLRS